MSGDKHSEDNIKYAPVLQYIKRKNIIYFIIFIVYNIIFYS